MKRKKYIVIFTIFFIIFSSFIFIVSAEDGVENYYRGRVISVVDIEQESDFFALEQQAEVLLTSGAHEGTLINIKNLFIEERHYTAIYLEEGTEVVIVAYRQDGQVNFYLQDIARDRGLLYLAIGFVVLILLVGMMQGVKTLLTLGITAFIIFKGMIPLLLAGYSPIPVATIAAFLIIFVILIIIGGVNSKSFAAIIGTSVGVLSAGIIAYYIGEISHLTGFSSSEAQMLVTGDFPIDIRGLLFAGIIIGSLGAITDVGMSVASAAEQVKEANPDIGFSGLMGAAFKVGRDIMGTMANTLILAYVGGSIHLLLLFQRYEVSWLRTINMDLIATEVVRGLAGSMGLIISIPITALVAGYLMSKN